LNRLRQWRASPYVAVVAVLWLATVQSGVHASIAGMVAGLLIPAWAPRKPEVETAASLFTAFRQSPMPSLQASASQGLARVISVNERLQTVLHPWASYLIVPVFALANARVDLRDGVLGDAPRSPATPGLGRGLA